MKKIFIDTWAWVALTNKRDSMHTQAKDIYLRLKQEGYILLTSNFILDESYTLIRNRMDLETAVKFGERISAISKTNLIEIIHVTDKIEEKAWKIFEKYKSQNFSFTDCTSFVVMKELDIHECFTGDEHFKIFGFFVIP